MWLTVKHLVSLCEHGCRSKTENLEVSDCHCEGAFGISVLFAISSVFKLETFIDLVCREKFSVIRKLGQSKRKFPGENIMGLLNFPQKHLMQKYQENELKFC